MAVTLVFPRSFASPLLACVCCLFVSLSLPQSAQAQLPGSDDATPDSLVERLGLPEGHSPRGALTRALAVPGWGQYYNRQYWKVPIAVAGLGGVLFALIHNWNRYYLYRDAYRYRRVAGQFTAPPAEGEPDPYDGDFGGPEYEEAYNAVRTRVGRAPGEALGPRVREARDQYLRRRELSILGVGLFWIFQVADAYVSAHLLGFEVGDDLSMRVEPGRDGTMLGVRLSF